MAKNFRDLDQSVWCDYGWGGDLWWFCVDKEEPVYFGLWR